jgi:DNA-binding MarR family transcriptional regulator
MKTKQLSQDYAIVLQQIDEDGSDDFDTLAETLRFDRGRLHHILQALRSKGLIVTNRDAQYETWISVSGKGRRLLRYLWPETRRGYSY